MDNYQNSEEYKELQRIVSDPELCRKEGLKILNSLTDKFAKTDAPLKYNKELSIFTALFFQLAMDKWTLISNVAVIKELITAVFYLGMSVEDVNNDDISAFKDYFDKE